jgi:hypothetical protein
MADTILQNYEQVCYGAPGLSMHRAKAFPIISSGVATRTLNAKDAGAVCCFDVASGVTYTLPPPVPGMTFTFVTSVTITSGSAKVVTDSATTFLLGAMSLVNNGATTAQAFPANGTTIRSVNGNGTTTGGIAGDTYTLTAISTTQWLVSGVMVNSGTAATPFATS